MVRTTPGGQTDGLMDGRTHAHKMKCHCDDYISVTASRLDRNNSMFQRISSLAMEGGWLARREKGHSDICVKCHFRPVYEVRASYSET